MTKPGAATATVSVAAYDVFGIGSIGAKMNIGQICHPIW